mmetsp:Transcript_32901/g.82652  ORF Transcript_32901/g.82652 Transcript_32901/m.82652 type:complete len:368 (-) Transcript_32901:279-1382(-)
MGVCGSKNQDSSSGERHEEVAPQPTKTVQAAAPAPVAAEPPTPAAAQPVVAAPPPKMHVKLLLLGIADAGKSTIARQLRYLYQNGFTPEEVQEFKQLIHRGVIIAIRALVTAVNKLNLQLQEESKSLAEKVFLLDFFKGVLTQEAAEDIKALWQDPALQDAYLNHGSEYSFHDNIGYFFDSLDRLAGEDYTPNQQDILRVRQKTVGVVSMDINIDGQQFQILDVAGQKSERGAWAGFFQNLDAFVYITSLADYDMNSEDQKHNRMQESLKVFSNLCQSEKLAHSSVILFLNKKDIFESKIQKTPLTHCFPDYVGTNDVDECVNFIQNKFVGQVAGRREVFPHITNACDGNMISEAFLSVKRLLGKKT